MQPQLEGKVDNGNSQKLLGVGIVIIAIVLIILAICTNMFGSDEGIFGNSGDVKFDDNEEIKNIFEEEDKNKNTTQQIPEDADKLVVYFFDVGQGESIFVENKGNTMLIDAGNNPDGKYISRYLRNTLKINKIDYLVATHSHEDHIGGMDIILEDFDIGHFFIPNQETESKSYDDVIKWAEQKDLDRVSPSIDRIFYVGDAICQIMYKNDETEDLNESSIIIELTYGEKKFLFTGDMGTTSEEAREWEDIDVLKVAHHGSTYSSSVEFLNQTKPEIAVISCGRDNDYYYPHEAVLKRLQDVGCNDIYITSEDNTIIITTDGNLINVQKQDIILDGNQ